MKTSRARRSLIIAAAVDLVSLAHPTVARADETSSVLTSATRSYRDGEKTQGYLWTGVGALGIGAGIAMYAHGTDYSRGASFPLGIAGLVHAAYGIGSIAMAGPRLAKDERAIREDAQQFQRWEHARIATANGILTVVVILEAHVVVAGAVVAILGANDRNDVLKGVGVGLAVEGTTTLALDCTALSRASGYEKAIASLHVRPTQGGGALLTYEGRF